MWYVIFALTVLVLGAVVYERSQRQSEKGKNITDPSTIPDLNPRVAELMDKG